MTTTTHLSCYEFGKELLRLNDLDPVYILLWEARLDRQDLYRWLLAYWCFYHVGTACQIAFDEAGYWYRMRLAAASKDWPRSKERRHFRGENARKSAEFLANYGIGELFKPFDVDGQKNLVVKARYVMEEVQGWVGFGPWIAFKAADMLERLGILQVEFDLDTILYDSPLKAARKLWEEHNPGINPATEPGGVGKWAVDMVLSAFGLAGGLPLAPPRYERPIGLQEVETILCKWGSYVGGHYHLGEDVTTCRAGLLRYARNPLCQQLLKAGRRGDLW